MTLFLKEPSWKNRLARSAAEHESVTLTDDGESRKKSNEKSKWDVSHQAEVKPLWVSNEIISEEIKMKQVRDKIWKSVFFSLLDSWNDDKNND